MRFKVLTAEKISSRFKPRANLQMDNQCFGETYCLDLQGYSPKCWYTAINLHEITMEKTNISILVFRKINLSI